MSGPITLLSRLLAARAEAFCQQYLPDGRREGHEWLVGNVEGAAGRSMAVQLDGPKAGLWLDHADRTHHGDLLDLLALRLGTKIKAADEARAFLGLPAWQPGQERNGQAPPAFDPLRHPYRPPGTNETRYAAAAWPYRDSSGRVFAFACRFNLPNGKKDILPLRLQDNQWRWSGWKGDEKRPIYGLDRLAARPDAPVLIVEGEKTADAARKLFPELVAIAWQGGGGAVRRVDWKPLGPRPKIVLWPDNDDPGLQAMRYLKAALAPLAVMVRLPPGLPEGWDLADPPPTDLSLEGLLDAAINPAPPPSLDTAPFRLLGMDGQKLVYLANASESVITLAANDHSELNLQLLAPDSYWQNAYRAREGADYKEAAKQLISAQQKAGLYDESRCRGAGCWIDDGRVIYHAGDHLLIDGVRSSLSSYRGAFIYPRSRRHIPLDLTQAASVSDLEVFLELCRALRWERHDLYWFFPGLCVCGIVCGALDWRPHGWLTGKAGAGKSWIITDLVIPLLGSGSVLQAQSSTTEPGIRQALARDAMPVVIDEAEPKDPRAIERIRAVLELMRQASSESAGGIIKGSSSGKAQTFLIRSTFLFASIGMGAKEAADESRLTRMELLKPLPEYFPEIRELCRRTVKQTAFCSRLRARVIRMAAIIRQSAECFTDTISSHTGDTRTGQQYGAIAAGFRALTHDTPASPSDAYQLANEIDWSAIRPDAGGEDDDSGRCLDILLQAKVETQDDSGRRFNHSVGELLACCLNEIPSESRYRQAYDALLRIGVHPFQRIDSFDIACRHTALDRIYHNSQFAAGWKDHLMRVYDASESVYCPPGGKTTKAVRIKRDSVDGLRRAEV